MTTTTAPAHHIEAFRALFGQHPDDVIASIKSGCEILDCLADLFKAIEMFLEKENQCHYEAKNLVGLGKYVAKDFSSYLDGEFRKLNRCIGLPAGKRERNDVRM